MKLSIFQKAKPDSVQRFTCYFENISQTGNAKSFAEFFWNLEGFKLLRNKVWTLSFLFVNAWYSRSAARALTAMACGFWDIDIPPVTHLVANQGMITKKSHAITKTFKGVELFQRVTKKKLKLKIFNSGWDFMLTCWIEFGLLLSFLSFWLHFVQLLFNLGYNKFFRHTIIKQKIVGIQL